MNIANSHTSTRNQNYCQDLITKNSGYNKNSGSSTPLSTSTTNCVWTTKVKTQLNIASGAATGLHSERTIPLSHSESANLASMVNGASGADLISTDLGLRFQARQSRQFSQNTHLIRQWSGTCLTAEHYVAAASTVCRWGRR